MLRIEEKLGFSDFGQWLRYLKEMIISCQIRVFAIIAAEIFSKLSWKS
jgi:hypothetical protein